ncbi:DUF3144 domain-containing protein [Phenylobacterium sp.]|uniref:DUF3144 domain-containing protein n=1 Tax=Phenylobacterium sp. TaxID=1871053 RepID=UPI00301CA44C
MSDFFDDAFYKRAEAHINLSNDQLDHAPREGVYASMMFSTARFCAWASASGFVSGESMKAKREETVEFFMNGFRQMLEGNLDAYIANFDDYMKRRE